MFSDKTILITGGTGTFGNAFVEKSLKENLFKKIIIFSRDEYKQFCMKKKFEKLFPENFQQIRFLLGDVRDKNRLLLALKNVDYCIGASALKRVDSIAYNISESIKTNILGSMNVVDASIECGLDKVVMISSDKAVMPETIYGSHKLNLEYYSVFSNSFSGKTKVCSMRYGNIFNSRGSIAELLLQDKKSPFYLTDNKMSRFFTEIETAVNLALSSLKNIVGGEIFIKKAKACNIERLIKVISPEREIKLSKITFAEKLHERLIADMETGRIAFNGEDYIILPDVVPWTNSLYEFYDKMRTNINISDFISNTAEQLTDNEILFMFNKEKQRLGLSD